MSDGLDHPVFGGEIGIGIIAKKTGNADAQPDDLPADFGIVVLPRRRAGIVLPPDALAKRTSGAELQERDVARGGEVEDPAPELPGPGRFGTRRDDIVRKSLQISLFRQMQEERVRSSQGILPELELKERKFFGKFGVQGLVFG